MRCVFACDTQPTLQYLILMGFWYAQQEIVWRDWQVSVAKGRNDLDSSRRPISRLDGPVYCNDAMKPGTYLRRQTVKVVVQDRRRPKVLERTVVVAFAPGKTGRRQAMLQEETGVQS